jgi:3-methyladenine DNA glycosylase AlkD
MTPQKLAEITRLHLKSAADPDFAAGARRFFREDIDPYGVRGPQVQAIARLVYRELKGWPSPQRDRYMVELWESGKLEEGAIVCYVYRRFSKHCAANEFKLFEQWLDRYVRNWSHCDGVSTWLIAASIANRPELIAKLPAWTKSKNRWKRRAAAVSLIQEAKRGENTGSIFRICEMLRHDPDDMVQKGVGWLLKETYPRKPREVLKFLGDWRATAPRLLLRYAAEKMTARDRKWVMGS